MHQTGLWNASKPAAPANQNVTVNILHNLRKKFFFSLSYHTLLSLLLLLRVCIASSTSLLSVCVCVRESVCVRVGEIEKVSVRACVCVYVRVHTHSYKMSAARKARAVYAVFT